MPAMQKKERVGEWEGGLMDRILDGSKRRLGLFQYYIPSTYSLEALFLSQEYSTRRTECLLSFSFPLCFCSSSGIFFDDIGTKLSGIKSNLQ
jgi:hypothetical protein